MQMCPRQQKTSDVSVQGRKEWESQGSLSTIKGAFSIGSSQGS